MKVFSFDLELNQAKTGAKIIEIGACIGETETKQVIDQYSCIVNPEEILEPKIIALTGISQDAVNLAQLLLTHIMVWWPWLIDMSACVLQLCGDVETVLH